MTSVERLHDESVPDIVEILALVLAGRIQKEDLDPNNRTVVDFYCGLMVEDPSFAEKVNFRKNQLQIQGIEPPRYTQEELRAAKKRRPKKRIRQPGFQPSLFPAEIILSPHERDPEKNIHQIGAALDQQQYIHPKDVLDEEIRHKRMELREIIGLPVARGKDPHVNDRMYQFLVRRVCSWDKFGIFNEYDRALDSHNLPEILITQIEQVKTFVGEFLNGNLNLRQQYNLYNDFFDQYNNQWFLDK